MKIGIISINMYSKGLNFACPLHSYAFQQFLLKNGIESTIIDYKPIYYDNFNLRDPYEYYAKKCEIYSKEVKCTKEEKKIRKQKLAENREKRDSWEPMREQRAIRHDKFQNFIDTRYIKTEECYDSDLLEAMDPGFDCYICATDVIWKNQPGKGFDRGYFLNSTAMENKWKISYAASRGVYWATNEQEEADFFRNLKDIDVVSVREASLQKYIQDNTDKDVKLVLDPVLLHEASFYDDIMVKPKEEGYLLLYYVMEKATDTIRQAVRYAKKHNLKIIEITDLPLTEGRLKNFDVDYELRYAIGIEEWLGYIKHADCVFTNSFHATCFSILFEKNFFVGFRHGDKLYNLIETFGLSDRRIRDDSDKAQKEIEYNLAGKVLRKASCMLNHKDWCTKLGKEDPLKKSGFKSPAAMGPIDFTNARRILAEKRKESTDFILGAIHSLEGQQRSPRDYDSYKKTLTYPVRYNSGLKNRKFAKLYNRELGELKKLKSGSLEYSEYDHLYVNNGTEHFLKVGYGLDGCEFQGWHIRIKIDNKWFSYLENGTLVPYSQYNKELHGPKYLFQDEETIPYIPVSRITSMVAGAVWKRVQP